MSQQTPSQIAELVRRAADDDQEAWDTLVTKYSGLLWSTVRRFRLGDEQTSDVVQMTWLRLVEHIGLLHNPERLPAWLVVTARNLSIEVIRRRRDVLSHNDDYDVPSNEESPEAIILRFELQGIVRDALKRLSDRDQHLLTLLVASPPIPYDEIGRRLGMPVGSIGPTRSRALRRLRAELEQSGVVGMAAN